MISTFDLEFIHENFNDIKTQYPDKSVRFQYFVATCLYLDADINLDFVFKNRPYGCSIGINSSSVDKHLKQINFLDYKPNCMTQQDICKKKIKPDLGTYI